MALYMSSVYLLSLPGGWIADRFLGQRKAVTYGGIGIMLGNALLAIPSDALFYPGLALAAFGTGFLKPNVSTIVGQLYKPTTIRGATPASRSTTWASTSAPFAAPLVVRLPRAERLVPALARDSRHRPAHCAGTFAFAAVAVGMAARPDPVRARLQRRWATPACTRRSRPIPRKAARDRTVLGVHRRRRSSAIGGRCVVVFVDAR